MVTITLDKEQETIKIPESWNEICLGDYEKWFDVTPKNRMEEIQLVAKICGINADILLENPTQLFDIVAQSVKFIFEPHAYEPSNKIRIGDQDYVIAFTNELTLAEWIDIESVFGEEEIEKHNRLSQILSILCRPQGEIYDNKLSESRTQLFSALTMNEAIPLLTFFLQRNDALEKISSLYSKVREQADLYLRHTLDSAKNGAGIKSLPIWQKIKYYYLTRYLKNQLSKYSDSCSTK